MLLYLPRQLCNPSYFAFIPISPDVSNFGRLLAGSLGRGPKPVHLRIGIQKLLATIAHQMYLWREAISSRRQRTPIVCNSKATSWPYRQSAGSKKTLSPHLPQSEKARRHNKRLGRCWRSGSWGLRNVLIISPILTPFSTFGISATAFGSALEWEKWCGGSKNLVLRASFMNSKYGIIWRTVSGKFVLSSF